MFEVRKFEKRNGFSCSMYIVKSEKGNFLVDPGYCDARILDYLESIGGLDFILITHGHFDHIYGIHQIIDSYPDCEVYAYKDELDVIYDPRKNCSVYFDGNRLEVFVDVNPLDEGIVQIKDHNIKVVHTPGHTKGGCLYIFDEDKAVFTGDTIICESIGRYDLPTSSESTLFNSLSKIKDLKIPNSYTAYFGHGEPFSFEKLYRVNPYMK